MKKKREVYGPIGRMTLKKNPRRAKLRPCPFDSGKARFITREGHLPHAVECRLCHSRTTWFRLQWMAAAKWNKRAGRKS